MINADDRLCCMMINPNSDLMRLLPGGGPRRSFEFEQGWCRLYEVRRSRPKKRSCHWGKGGRCRCALYGGSTLNVDRSRFDFGDDDDGGWKTGSTKAAGGWWWLYVGVHGVLVFG